MTDKSKMTEDEIEKFWDTHENYEYDNGWSGEDEDGIWHCKACGLCVCCHDHDECIPELKKILGEE